MAAAAPVHVLLFPFMSKGHTIPLLHLTRVLLLRCPQANVTIFTTPGNKAFIFRSLSDLLNSGGGISIIDLPFPSSIPGIPSGVESTDQLPTISLFLSFATAAKLLQPHFEDALQNLLSKHHHHRPCTFLISDGFLHWTLQSASKFNIPRFVFYGMGGYALTLSTVVSQRGLLSGPESDDEPITVPDFPWIKLTRNDFEHPFNMRQPKGPHFDFVVEMGMASASSYGMVVNSFYELEHQFVDYWNAKLLPRAWCVGPLCLAEKKPKSEAHEKPTWLDWLDQKLAQGRSVLYVAFGTQAEVSNEQLREIAIGLEKSEVDFLWAVSKRGEQQQTIIDGFEEKVVKNEGRGLVVREWVEQRQILGHESVKGFLSHCGWNSVVESICAKVPILAWPMMAEQHLNARIVVEEIKVGVRVETWNGSVRGFVRWEGLEKTVRELMEGETGKAVRKKVAEVGQMASNAMEEGGSSRHALDLLLHELQAQCTNSADSTGKGPAS
ncbi:hypothetical protein Nepgr_001179 [Nepenthes gracilis]|uniref:Glycosyltransferase n=1 Tax=Nepenthes gracilis TaxID=150966 RepID=A0AAD3P2E5_NEPGR|nr:hypothetical protein Nepgr_001179 [Nepenthes gracilis]